VAMLKPITPVIAYYINYDYIVAELCENKAKPILKCNGKCHLAKELKKVNNGIDSKKPVPPLNMKDYPIAPFFTQTVQLQHLLFRKYITVINGVHNIFINTYSNSIFHPPKFIV